MDIPLQRTDAGGPRRLLFETLKGQRYEQGVNRLVYRDGEMLWPRPPLACCSAHSEQERPIAVGAEAVFMFALEFEEGLITYIHITAPLRKISTRPARGPKSHPRHWLRLARRKLGLAAPPPWVAP